MLFLFYFFLLLLSSKPISAFNQRSNVLISYSLSTVFRFFIYLFFSGWHKLLLLSSQLLRDAVAGLMRCGCFGGRCDEISTLVAEVDARARSAQTPGGGV